MKNLILMLNNGKYDLKGTSYFETKDGNEYNIDRENCLELAAMLLEALGMDLIERDKL